MNPHQATRDLERVLCEYTGARFATCTNSCTMALQIALDYHIPEPNRYKAPKERVRVSIPRPGYISVPQVIVHAGGWPVFRDEEWSGCYQLQPFEIYDCARRFRAGMYQPGQYQCVSFHASKILGVSQGGAVLHDDLWAQEFFQSQIMDARTPGVPPKMDKLIGMRIGRHCYMDPGTAANLTLRMYSLPKENPDLPNDDYPDFSTLEIYRL